jgi:hypothetical protein
MAHVLPLDGYSSGNAKTYMQSKGSSLSMFKEGSSNTILSVGHRSVFVQMELLLS